MTVVFSFQEDITYISGKASGDRVKQIVLFQLLQFPCSCLGISPDKDSLLEQILDRLLLAFFFFFLGLILSPCLEEPVVERILLSWFSKNPHPEYLITSIYDQIPHPLHPLGVVWTPIMLSKQILLSHFNRNLSKPLMFTFYQLPSLVIGNKFPLVLVILGVEPSCILSSVFSIATVPNKIS